ncbi:MAG: hypothetical protein H0T42_18955 [Deltaproteobacteria bacterium]|nr:hypothetical protein [Deltaproteobacteria bacterium]
MRAVLILVVSGACAGPMRPVVLNRMGQLPADPGKRDAVLDSSVAQPGPEQRQRLSPKAAKVETAAATAAAVLGSLFSKTRNVTIGGGGGFEENALFEDKPQPKREKAAGAEPVAPAEPIDGTKLVPWIKLGP